MTDEPIIGAVANGKRVAVVFPFYTGRAGMQQTEDGIQVACVTRASARPQATGTVDGKTVKVIASARSNTVDGILILTVEPVD